MAQEDPPAIYSGRWLRTRSEEDLRAIMDGSYPTSQAFEGARGELNRRQSERDVHQQLRWIRLTFWTALALGLAGIAATLLS
jgi:hypothetical protein